MARSGRPNANDTALQGPATGSAGRATYRHGDLQRALLEAGIALARDGGPDAIVLREATRRAGVVPNAAYRHFASRLALLDAVRAAALAMLARTMEAELRNADRKQHSGDACERARARLRAVGAGYLRFAQTEPGLFRTAFASTAAVEHDADPAKAGSSGMNPFQLLGAALDGLVDCGALPVNRRPGAEYLAWSAVHGLALLLLDGPLRHADRVQRRALEARLLRMVEDGL